MTGGADRLRRPIDPGPTRRSSGRSNAPSGSCVRLDAVVEEAIAGLGIPGVQATLILDGEVVWEIAAGVRRMGTDEPVTGETLFPLASLGKLLMASWVMRRASAGHIGLDESIASQGVEDVPGADAVTPRMLLSHTAGYPDIYASDRLRQLLLGPDGTQAETDTKYDPRRQFGWGDVLPAFEAPVRPGERWEYSNGGYILLARLLSISAGGDEKLPAAWAHVLGLVGPRIESRKLTIERSVAPVGRLAEGHFRDSAGEVVAVHPPDAGGVIPGDLYGLPFGDGMFAGTATAAALFMDALFVRRVILDHRRIAEMIRQTDPARRVNERYGMGVELVRLGNELWPAHLGNYGGFTSIGASDPRSGTTLVVLANCTDRVRPAGMIARRLASALAR